MLLHKSLHTVILKVNILLKIILPLFDKERLFPSLKCCMILILHFYVYISTKVCMWWNKMLFVWLMRYAIVQSWETLTLSKVTWSALSIVCCLSLVLFVCPADHRWNGLIGGMFQWRWGLCWVRRTRRWARSVEFCLPFCGDVSFATEDQILKASPPPMDRKSVTSQSNHVHQYRDIFRYL